MSEIVNVPFYGQNLVAVEKNGRIYVAMKPIVEAIGLEWNRQLEHPKSFSSPQNISKQEDLSSKVANLAAFT